MRTMMQCVFCQLCFHNYAEWYSHTMAHLMHDAEMSIAKVYKALIYTDIFRVQYN